MKYFVKVVEDDQERRDHERVRYEVYVREKRWTPQQAAPNGRERDELDDASTLLIAYDLSGDPAGSLRLIRRSGRPDSSPLPVEVAPFYCAVNGSRRAVEASRLAVAPRYRGDGAVMLGLCRLAVAEMLRKGDDDCYAIVEEPLLRSLRRIGFPFARLAAPVDFFGGMVAPVLAGVGDMQAGAIKSEIYSSLFQSPFDGLIDSQEFGW